MTLLRTSAFLLAVCVARIASAQGQLDERIDRFVQEEMQRQRVPGLAVGVVRDGTVVTLKGYGLANVEHRAPVSPDTVFESGSIGKQFTAVAVMLLVEDGALSLDDAIVKFFPGAPQAWRGVTVRHLLTHTSGIPDYEDGTLDYQKNYSEEDLVRFASGLPLEFAPGARWNYSSTGYILLGAIVHAVSGQFYGELLAARVFAPLGMTTARVISEADIVANRAAGYRLVSGELKNQEWVSPTLNTTADGSIYFTLRDMVAWDTAVRTRALLSQDSWNLILQPVRLRSGKPYPYGFAWFLDERGGQPMQWHSGAWQGFRTRYVRFIRDDVSIVVLANLAQADPARIANGIAAIVNPRLADVREPIPDQEPQITARLARLLDAARAGTLAPAEFAFVRAGFFPTGAKVLQDQLRTLGAADKLVLVERSEKGDDRLFTYDVAFASRSMSYSVGLARDDRISLFELREK